MGAAGNHHHVAVDLSMQHQVPVDDHDIAVDPAGDPGVAVDDVDPFDHLFGFDSDVAGDDDHRVFGFIPDRGRGRGSGDERHEQGSEEDREPSHRVGAYLAIGSGSPRFEFAGGS